MKIPKLGRKWKFLDIRFRTNREDRRYYSVDKVDAVIKYYESLTPTEGTFLWAMTQVIVLGNSVRRKCWPHAHVTRARYTDKFTVEDQQATDWTLG